MKKILFLKDGWSVGGTTSSFADMLSAMAGQTRYEVFVFVSGGVPQGVLPSGIHEYTDHNLEAAFTPRRTVGRLAGLVLSGGAVDYLKARHRSKVAPNDRSRLIPLYQKLALRQARHAPKADLSDFEAVISWEELFPCYYLAERIRASRKIAWIHPHYEQCGFDPAGDRETFGKLDAVVAVSPEGETALKQAFPCYADRMHTVRNCLNVKRIQRLAAEPIEPLAPSVVNLLTVARIQNISKAYDRAVRLAASLHREGIPFCWYFIGDGEDRAAVERQVAEAGLSSCVKVLGSRDNPYPYMAAADVTVLQSYYEGRPMVVDESLIIGTPVLVSRYSSAEEQVDLRYGWIADNTEEALLKALRAVIAHREERRQKAEALRGMDRSRYETAQALESLLDEVTDHAGKIV